jgi:hypothetical protein
MKKTRFPIIDYASRTEKLTPGEWWAKAPRRFTLLIFIILNWAVCGCTSYMVGGDAIGTMPSAQGYVVKTQGHFTTVSESVWYFSLVYPATTFLLTPLAIVLVVAALLRGVFKGRPPFFRAALLFCPIYLPLAYTIMRDTLRSALDAWRLDSHWPTISWLLLSVTAVMVSLLAIGANWERKHSGYH